MLSKKDGLKISIVLFIIIPLLFLAGCHSPEVPMPEITPTLTPTPIGKNSVMVLPDGSKIVLRPETNLDIIMLAGIIPEISEIRVLLNQGEILVVPKLAPGKWFTVLNPGGYVARIDGCAMVVSNNVVVSANSASGSFEIKCIAGRCEFGPDANHLFAVASNENGINQVSLQETPPGFDLEQLKALYGSDYPDCSQYIPLTGEEIAALPTQQVAIQSPLQATEIPTMQPTFDLAATATASCLEFQANFPRTPCP